MSAKEKRYRLLLELYPVGFRRQYADEMLGVLMADPVPVRKHAPSLLAGAVGARVRPTFEGPEWRRAASAVQMFGAILLCAVALRRLVTVGSLAIVLAPSDVPAPDVFDVVRFFTWAAVLVGALAGVRALSVTAALAGLVAEIAAASRQYAEAPVMFLSVYWIVMSAALVLVASTVSVRGPRPRGWPFVVAAGVLLAGNSLLARVPYLGYVGAMSFYESNSNGYGITLLLVGAAGVLALVGVIRLEPAVRRRAFACMVPVAAVFPLVGYGFGGLVDFNMRHPDDIRLLGPVQWAALVIVPALAFWTAAGLNRRLERSRAAATSVVSADARPEN